MVLVGQMAAGPRRRNLRYAGLIGSPDESVRVRHAPRLGGGDAAWRRYAMRVISPSTNDLGRSLATTVVAGPVFKGIYKLNSETRRAVARDP